MNQPFIGHVQELKRRLFRSALVVFLVAFAAYFWHEPILGWLEAPLRQTLYYSRVTGAFEFIVQACMLAGFLIAAPLIIYELIAFIQPALPKPIRRRTVILVIFTATILILSGVAFGYYVSLPAALHFLGTIDTSHLHPLLAADSYLTFVINYLAVFGLVFLLPLLIIFYDSISPLPPSKLVKLRKWVIIGAFAAALILPIAPDPVSQILLAVPLIVMYEISILCLRVRHWTRRASQVRPVIERESEMVVTVAAPEDTMIEPPPPTRQPAGPRRRQPPIQRPAPVLDLRQRSGAIIDLRNVDLSYRPHSS